MTGRTVDLRVEVDEALIGGLTVRVGDTLYDASVRGRLERLRERLVAGAR
jgi:F-type H+-transporting ATPase subunit delta